MTILRRRQTGLRRKASGVRSGAILHDRPDGWIRHFGSWRLRLLVLVLLAILPSTLLTAWERHRTAEARIADAGEDLAALALNTAREQAALVGRAQTFLAALARLPALSEGTPAECQPVLASFGGSASWRHTLGVYAPDGQPVCTDQPGQTPGLRPVDHGLADETWFRAAIAGGRFVLSDLVIGRLVLLPMVMAVQPILGLDGAVRRLVVAGIDLAQLGGQALPQVPAGAEVLLLADAAGTVVARYPAAPGLVGRSLYGTGLAQAMRGEVGYARGSGLLGGDRLFGFAPIPGTQATLVVGRDTAGILASVSALQRQVLLLAGSAALVALLLALAAGHWMVLRPMAEFAEAVRQIARGNLGARAETGRLGGELGALAREINGMAHRLAEHQAALEAKHREMAQLAAALGAARDTAEAASAAKTRFVGMLSHELRTPLNGIFGHAQLLGADPSLSPMQRRHAEQITASGDHLMSMIRELLDLAAIEAGRVSLEPAPVRLAGVVEACAALMRPVASGKGLGFGVELAPGAAAWVAADALRLRQVLLNLLANAVKFTHRGEVVLRIQATPDGLTRFEVSDTGPGLDAAERAALFQEFMRLPGRGPVRGQRPRPGDYRAAGRPDGRDHRGRERPRLRQPVLGRAAPAAGACRGGGRGRAPIYPAARPAAAAAAGR